MKKRYLVTGSSGFIGSHLVRALEARGDTVDRMRQDLDMQMPLEVDGVFHLAGAMGSRDTVLDPLTMLRTNAHLAERLIETYQHTPVTIVFVSTSEVYYGQPTALPTPETAPVGWSDPFSPRWAYAVSKFLAEELLAHAAAASTMQVRIARLGNVYGPGSRHGVVHDLLTAALGGGAWTVRNPEDTRTFCYVSDIAEGLIHLMESENRDGVLGMTPIVNLAGDQPISIAWLVKKIRSLTGAPEPTPETVALLETRWPAIDKARLLLDWQPRVALHEGLFRTIEWLKGAHEIS